MMQYLKMIAQHANSWTCSSHYVCHYCLSPLLPCFWKLFSVSQHKLPICVDLILKCFVNMSLLWNWRSVKGQAFVGVNTAHWKGRGQECLIPSQAFRCASWAVRIPVWEQRRCRASVDPSFTARHNMPVSVTFRVLETLLKSENSKSQILGFFWDRLVFFLAILVNWTYIHAHACLCRRTDIFPEHEIQKREQKHGFFPLSCHFLTKKKRTS